MKRTERICEGLTGEAIVVFGAIDWDFIWHWQEISLRLAQAGNMVLYVENTGVRGPTLRDIPRIFARLRNWWKGTQGFREHQPGLVVLSPLVLPFPYSRLARRINAWLLDRSIGRWLRATKRSSPVVFTFLPTPLVLDVIEELEPSLVVFYCAENFAASSKGAKPVESSERQLLRAADLVFVNSRKLQAKAQQFRPEAQLFPVGVNLETFAPQGAREVPPDLSAISRPRCVYIGGLHQWIDIELVRSVAAARPDYQFVFVGPEQVDMSGLKGLPNVHLLGPRPHQKLPEYIGACDVGLIPYRVTSYTEGMYPAKLAEYLAMGLPVVSTFLPEVVAFSKAHGDVVRLGRTNEEFTVALDHAVRDGNSGHRTRLEAARLNGWASRVDGMSALMRKALEANREQPRVVPNLLQRIALRYRRSGLRWLWAPIFLLLVLRFTPLAWWLSHPLIIAEAPQRADAIVVIGGGTGEVGDSTQGHEERIDAAIGLYRGGYAPRILICSGAKSIYRESEIMRALALSLSIPDRDILLSSEKGGTYRMIAKADEEVRARGWKRVLLVSSPFHMRRALGTWRVRNANLQVVPVPPSTSRFYRYSDREGIFSRRNPTWMQLRGLVIETLALAYYRLRGWSGSVP